MSSPLALRIKDRIFVRLKEARNRIGLKQTELAEVGHVSRATQISYETDTTEPTTAYLRKIQSTGIDIPYVLFDSTLSTQDNKFGQVDGVDWALVQQAHEDVEFFCLKFAPSCPQSYRWKLVSQIYSVMKSGKLNGKSAPTGHQEIIKSLWEHA